MYIPKKVNEFKTVIQQDNDAQSDTDSDSSDDFVEVKPENEEEEDPDIELRYLGFLKDDSSEYTNVFAHIFLHAIITKKLYLCTVCWHRITCF
jgi:hypothetical protein